MSMFILTMVAMSLYNPTIALKGHSVTLVSWIIFLEFETLKSKKSSPSPLKFTNNSHLTLLTKWLDQVNNDSICYLSLRKDA
jgi:hypothetical protein